MRALFARHSRVGGNPALRSASIVKGWIPAYAGMTMMLLVACGSASAPPTTAPSVQTLPAATTNTPPEAARRVPEELLTKDGVYYGCRVNSDCQVKDIGNCCGYYPACVNKDSPTFPEQVKANCAKEGRMAICGFPNITDCECLEGRCTNVVGPGAQPAPSEQ